MIRKAFKKGITGGEMYFTCMFILLNDVSPCREKRYYAIVLCRCEWQQDIENPDGSYDAAIVLLILMLTTLMMMGDENSGNTVEEADFHRNVASSRGHRFLSERQVANGLRPKL